MRLSDRVVKPEDLPMVTVMSIQADLTAIVVNWNAGAHLKRCVGALLAQGRDLDLEVVVVDNASSDTSLRELAAFGDRVRLIQTGENLGFGRGVNRGLAGSGGAYVVALNPDVVLQPGALLRLVRFLERVPQAGLVGPRLSNVRGQIQASCGRPPRLTDEICRKFLLHLIFPLFKFRRWCPSEPTAVGWVTGACFAARRAALEAVGGLDEAIFMYYEDVDLCLRVRQAGWQVFYLPEAEGMHAGGASSKRALARMLVVSEASYAYLVRKHLGRAAELLLRGLRPVEMGLRWLLWGALFLIRPGCRQEARARLQAYGVILKRGFGEILISGPSERVA